MVYRTVEGINTLAQFNAMSVEEKLWVERIAFVMEACGVDEREAGQIVGQEQGELFAQ